MVNNDNTYIYQLFTDIVDNSMSKEELLNKIKAYKDELKASVMVKKEKLETIGYKEYLNK